MLVLKQTVRIRQRLDRELEDRYLVTVLAVDGGDPPKTGSVLVNITVLDANDNNPQFDNSSYEVESGRCLIFETDTFIVQSKVSMFETTVR